MAIVFPYVKNTTWADGSGGGTSIDAADLNKIEDGIFNMHQGPAVRVARLNAQSIPNATETAIVFDTAAGASVERFDQAGGSASTQHSLTTNPTRLTALYAGIYLAGFQMTFVSNATGFRYAIIRSSLGTTGAMEQKGAVSGQAIVLTGAMPISLGVNDYIELFAWQNSTAALNSDTSNIPEFWMVRVA